MNRQDWFMTAIWTDYIDEIDDRDIEAAKEFCHVLKETTEGVDRSNKGGWQSKDYTPKEFKHDNEPFQKIISSIEKRVLPLEPQYAITDLRLGNFWININYKNDFNEYHWHPNSFLSAVFYLTDNNSEIIFKRSHGPEMAWLHNGRSSFTTDLSYTTVTYKPASRHLVVFPGHLEHCVQPNINDTPRISIALNFCVDHIRHVNN